MAKKLMTGDHWAYFGCGNQAKIIDSKEDTDENGNKVIKFIFLPTSRIEDIYDIADEQDEFGYIVKEYDERYVKWLERGIHRSVVWIFLDFNGGHTIVSRMYQDLVETIKDTERLMRSAEAAKNRAYQELDMERQQKIESFKYMTKMIKEIAKARGRTDDGEGGMDPMELGE